MPALRRHCLAAPHVRGFTLVELLVAITVMSLMAVLAWRGLDGMIRAREASQGRADELFVVQAGLSQWRADLDAVVDSPQAPTLTWDGRSLRLLRRVRANGGEAVQVVAWTRRAAPAGTWLRWQSQPLGSRTQWQQAWEQADLWARDASAELRRRETALFPLQDWQVFFFRGESWTNPLSSVGADEAATAAGASGSLPALPDGVRLQLSLPEGASPGGVLTLDWVRPELSRSRS